MSPAVNDTDTYTIICLIAKETISRKWILNQNNTYYVNCLENDLSDDFWVKVNDNFFPTTRLFSGHILMVVFLILLSLDLVLDFM